MKKIFITKCLSIASAALLIGSTLLYPNTSKASEDEGGPRTTVKCPDGNTYVCATSGGITAYKGKGETIIIIE